MRLLPVEGEEVMGASGCASDYFDYDFIDLEYRYVDFDEAALDDGHGVTLGLSKTLTECTFFTLGGLWQQNSLSGSGDTFDFWSFSGGVGMVFPFSERVHLVGEAGAFYGFSDGLEDDQGSWGGFITPTLRIGITRALEGFAAVSYVVDEENDQFEYSAGAILRLTEVIGLKARWAWNDDEQSVGVGLRVAF